MRGLFRSGAWSRRVKMAVLLVVASLLPFGLAAFIDIREARQQLLATTEALLAARGDQLVGEMDTFHRGFQRSAERLARLPGVIAFCQATAGTRERVERDARAILDVWSTSDPKIRGVALLDRSGVVTLGTEPQLVGLNLSFRSFVQKALQGEAVISDIFLAAREVDYAPTIAYLVPVRGPDQAVIGLVALWVRATSLWATTKASNALAGPDSFAVLFDHQGIRIAHTYSDDIVFHPGGRLDRATLEALIRALSSATETIAGGDLTARVPLVARADELGRLSESFNSMAGRIESQAKALERARDDLELRVEQRTSELVQTTKSLQLEIVERKRAELALREREEDLATTLNSIGDAVIATDAEGRVTKMNPVAEQFTGWSFTDAKGKNLPEVFRILNEDSREPVESPVERVLREGIVVGLANHTALVSRDGTERAIADSGAPIRDAEGKTRGVVLVFHDQTKQRQADRELRQSAARLRVLAETSRQFSATTDFRSVLDLVARRLSELVGDICAIRLVAKDREWLEAEGAVYHPDPDILAVAREVLSTLPQRVGEGLTGSVAATGEAVLVPVIETAQLAAQAPPKYRPLVERLRITSVLVVPLKSRGRVIGVINLTRSDRTAPYTPDDQRLAQDLADRAALAIENALLVSGLEERVAQRTAAVEGANRELEAFSYSVAHDLRAPLRGMNGFAQVLLDTYKDKLDAEGQDWLQEILLNAKKMGALIDGLLSLARVTRSELKPEHVDLSGIVREVAAHLRASEAQRTIEIEIQDKLHADVDSRLARALVENLLGNAWKFTCNVPVARIEFGATEEDGSLAFFVRDNGAGFDMAFASKLFEPFQRLHTADEFPGTGIGLATVQRIVHCHGGRVWAEGAIDGGATIYFTFPARGWVATQ